MKSMRPAALASLAVVLALAGCGGATPTQTESAGIPHAVADRLAAQSESIAAAWEAGDSCGAAQQADDLRHAADDAIAAGQIPASYQDNLESAVVNLQNTANCVEEDDHNGPGKEEDKPKPKPKPKGHDKHEDDVTTTADTVGTTTEESG
jgi:hypothetical protein